MANSSEISGTPAPRLPVWAKGLIAVMILAFFGGIVAVSSVINFGATLAKHATEPAYIATVMHSVADIPRLPQGFTYKMAAEAFNNHMVTIVHEPDKTIFMLGSIGPTDTGTKDAKELVHQMAEHGVPGFTDSFQVDKDGEELVAGKTMEYVTGRSSDREGDEHSGMIGCILEKEKKQLTLIYGWSETKSFNLETARKLLGSIKSI